MRNKLLSSFSILFFIGLSVILYSQSTGTPSQLRVKTDANNYLLASGIAGQTTPITTTTFSNTRLKTDSNGYLLISVVGGTTAQNTFCLDATNKDIYLARASANTFGFYTSATNCASGTLQVRVNSSGLGIGTGIPTSVIAYYLKETNAHTQILFENTRNTAGDYLDYNIKSGTTTLDVGVSNENYGAGPLGSNRGWFESSSIAGSGIDFASNAATGLYRFYIGGEGSGNEKLRIDSTGLSLVNNSALLWITDNGADIGASGATRPRTGFFGTSVVSPLVTARLVSSGAVTAVANVGANSCGTTAASIAGTDDVGAITVGATAGTQCRIQFTVAAPTRRHCTVTDETTGNLMRATYVDTTHTDILGTMVAADVITYNCHAR